MSTDTDASAFSLRLACRTLGDRLACLFVVGVSRRRTGPPCRAADLRCHVLPGRPSRLRQGRPGKAWQGHADLGYDRLQGAHFPPPSALPSTNGLAGIPTDPLAEAPLWRLRRLVEVAVSGGRRALAEPARDGDRNGGGAALRRTGFRAAADLAAALTAEADRRSRDVFGRITDPDPDRYARAWLATAVYLAGTERALVQATWQPPVAHPHH